MSNKNSEVFGQRKWLSDFFNKIYLFAISILTIATLTDLVSLYTPSCNHFRLQALPYFTPSTSFIFLTEWILRRVVHLRRLVERNIADTQHRAC
jgi:hypothetical protein